MNHIDPFKLGDEEFLARARVACSEKAAWTTRSELVTYLRQHDYTGSTYKCPICGFYHHTTYNRCKSKVFAKRLRRCLNQSHQSQIETR